jgi:hypothetical protein
VSGIIDDAARFFGTRSRLWTGIAGVMVGAGGESGSVSEPEEEDKGERGDGDGDADGDSGTSDEGAALDRLAAIIRLYLRTCCS